MSTVLAINALNKHYGRIHAVNNLELKIPRGSVFGILGPNGSGKTTTLGMVLGVVRKNSGGYDWFEGEEELKARKRIGAILEKPTFYPYLSAVDNLKIVAKIKDVDLDNVDEILDSVNLLDRKNDKFKSYSLGMKQRLAIASALLCDPEVLVLDEPTNGLDPMGIAEVREIILKIAQTGKTIILASHLLDEVQKVCSHFAILRNGQLIHQGLVNEDLGDQLLVEVGYKNLNQLEEVLQTYPAYKSSKRENGHLLVSLDKDSTAAQLNQWLFKKDLVLDHLVSRKRSLEEQFLEIVGNNS